MRPHGAGDVGLRQHRIEKAEEALYSLIFVPCEPSEGRASTSFDLEAKFYYKGRSYLSACAAPLQPPLKLQMSTRSMRWWQHALRRAMLMPPMAC